MLGSSNTGGSCPSNLYNYGKISGPYGSFVQCLPNSLGIPQSDSNTFNNFPDAGSCWDKCAQVSNGREYASWTPYGNRQCKCFDTFAGSPSTCTSTSVYIWSWGANVVVSDSPGRRRRALEARRQQALRDAHPYCPIGYEACRVPGAPRAEASYECIVPALELGESSKPTARTQSPRIKRSQKLASCYFESTSRLPSIADRQNLAVAACTVQWRMRPTPLAWSEYP